MTYDGMQQVWEEKFIMREREDREKKRVNAQKGVGGLGGRKWENVRKKEEERLNSSHTSGQDGRLDRAWQVPEQ